MYTNIFTVYSFVHVQSELALIDFQEATPEDACFSVQLSSEDDGWSDEAEEADSSQDGEGGSTAGDDAASVGDDKGSGEQEGSCDEGKEDGDDTQQDNMESGGSRNAEGSEGEEQSFSNEGEDQYKYEESDEYAPWRKARPRAGWLEARHMLDCTSVRSVTLFLWVRTLQDHQQAGHASATPMGQLLYVGSSTVSLYGLHVSSVSVWSGSAPCDLVVLLCHQAGAAHEQGLCMIKQCPSFTWGPDVAYSTLTTTPINTCSLSATMFHL